MNRADLNAKCWARPRKTCGSNIAKTSCSSSPRPAEAHRDARPPVWPLCCARAFALALLSTSIAALLLAPIASAEVTHLYDSSTTANFGSIAGGLGLAIDQSNGDVYVAQLNGGSVRKFTSTGNPISSFGGGTGEISFGGPWGLAVDQNSHDLYVSNGGNAVYKFDSEGNPVSSFGSNGQLGVANCIGVAVDPVNGDLYVANAEGKVEVFTSSGVPVREFTTGPVTAPLGIAVDAAGRVYVDGGGYIGGGPGLERFNESGTREGMVEPGGFQGVTIDPATDDVYTTQGGELAEYSPGGETLISQFGGGVVNDAWGVGVNETTGEIYTATYYGSSVDAFGPTVIIPNVTSNPPTLASVDHTTAVLTGQIDPAGGPEVTECAIEYGTTTEYLGGKVPCETSTPITAPTEVSAKLTGLTPLMTYHYRFVAKNENGPNYGQDQTVEPPAVFGLNTEPASGITATEGKLSGSFQVDPEGGETHYYFEWGLTKSYGAKTPEASTAQDGLREVSATVNTFTFSTLYHYRLVATNSLGTSYGPDQTLQTELPGLPRVVETSSSAVNPESATFEAEVNPEFGPTVVRFEYGPGLSYGSRTPPTESIGEDGIEHHVSILVTGLRPGETYHYRVLAINFSGIVTGPDMTLDTTDTPTASTMAASAVTQTAATLTAQIKPGFSPTTYRFDYGTSVLYGTSTTESSSIGSDDAVHTVTDTIGDLTPNTTYHDRIVATNQVGDSTGADLTFTTAPVAEQAKPIGPIRCTKKHETLKHGKCVKKSRARHRRHHRVSQTRLSDRAEAR